MADISIQFFATDREIRDWLTDWLHLEEIALVAMAFQPFSVEQVVSHEIRSVLCDSKVARLCLLASQPNLDVQSKLEFERDNIDELVLDVGHLSEEGLRESWLACRSENTDAMSKWRQIAKDLKSKTSAGVTAINRQNGVSAFYKSDRYSQGAKELEDAGTRMLPIQGPDGPFIRLGNVDAGEIRKRDNFGVDSCGNETGTGSV